MCRDTLEGTILQMPGKRVHTMILEIDLDHVPH